jgi:hypothetical protein
MDSTGLIWTITTGGQIAKNGVADTTTSNVVLIAYKNSEVYQQNNQLLWWGWVSNAWARSYNPFASANKTVITGITT